MEICSVKDCGRSRSYASGLCGMHYARQKRHGSLEDPRRNIKICGVPDCRKEMKSNGLCQMHYMRLRRHGDPGAAASIRGSGEEARFWRKVNKDGPIFKLDPCWEWVGSHTRRGYGNLRGDHGNSLRVHQFAYRLLIGPVPKGMEVDHVCRNSGCVNPNHLRAVPHLVNMSTAIYPNRLKTHCPRGHEYTESSFRQSGARRCLICERERSRR